MALAAQFAPAALFDVKSASTLQLLGLLGLLVLPAVTASALLVDAHFLRRRRRVSAAMEVIVPLATPAPVVASAPSAPPSPAIFRPSAWPTGPQPARVHAAVTPGQGTRRPVPRVEIIVERKSVPQVFTISRPAEPVKSAA
ncbi:MAG: hypothetical protein ACKVZJ_03140 [Phycisphaerales bacterium]